MQIYHKLIKGKKINYLVTQSPSDANINNYVTLLKQFNIKKIIRTCGSKYKLDILKENQIELFDIFIEDGFFPVDSQIDELILILNQLEEGSTIAIHCVAGLGRAPTMVALALIILDNMKSEDAIKYIRSIIRGSFSSRQLHIIFSYIKKRQNKSICIIS